MLLFMFWNIDWIFLLVCVYAALLVQVYIWIGVKYLHYYSQYTEERIIRTFKSYFYTTCIIVLVWDTATYTVHPTILHIHFLLKRTVAMHWYTTPHTTPLPVHALSIVFNDHYVQLHTYTKLKRSLSSIIPTRTLPLLFYRMYVPFCSGFLQLYWHDTPQYLTCFVSWALLLIT